MIWKQSWPPWRAAPSALSWPPGYSFAPPRLSFGWGLPPRCSPAGRCCWPGSSPSFISWASCSPPQGCTTLWGVVLQNIAATFNTKLQIERMRSILEQAGVQTGEEDFRPSRYDITFDHVSFAYREGAGVLDDVSFTARQGEVTALIGPSGGGKSTACKLAARFWDVTGGKVLLGGTGRVHSGTRRPSCAPTPWCSRMWCCSGTR